MDPSENPVSRETQDGDVSTLETNGSTKTSSTEIGKSHLPKKARRKPKTVPSSTDKEQALDTLGLRELKNIYWQAKLKDWYIDQELKEIYVSDQDISTQALNFRAMYGDEYSPFTVTTTWISNFKKECATEQASKSGKGKYIKRRSCGTITTYSFEKKLKILNKLKTEPFPDICRKFKLHPERLSSWMRQRDLIEELAHDRYTKNKKRMNFVIGVWQVKLKDWYLDQQSKGIKVSDHEVCTQALNFYENLSKIYDVARPLVLNNEWLYCWKKAFDIKDVTKPEEKIEVNREEKIKVNIKTEEKHEGIPIITIHEHEYNWCQIFYYGEGNFYYREIPDENFEIISENVADLKMLKDFVTVGICTNADGSLKLPLTPVGRWQSFCPSCIELRDQSDNHNESHYRIWMNEDLFKKWIETEFVPQVERFLCKKNLPLKVLFIVDNASTLTAIDNVRTWFSPLSVTLVAQAVCPDILVVLNLGYKRKLAAKIIENSKLGVMKLLSDIKLPEVIQMMTDSWKEIRSDVIHSYWQKMWPAIIRCIESSTDDSESIAGYVNTYHVKREFNTDVNVNEGHTSTTPTVNSTNGSDVDTQPAASSINESHADTEPTADNITENHMGTESPTDSMIGNPLESTVIIDSIDGNHNEQIPCLRQIPSACESLESNGSKQSTNISEEAETAANVHDIKTDNDEKLGFRSTHLGSPYIPNTRMLSHHPPRLYHHTLIPTYYTGPNVSLYYQSVHPPLFVLVPSNSVVKTFNPAVVTQLETIPGSAHQP